MGSEQVQHGVKFVTGGPVCDVCEVCCAACWQYYVAVSKWLSHLKWWSAVQKGTVIAAVSACMHCYVCAVRHLVMNR